MDFALVNTAVLATFGEAITIAGTPLRAVYDSRHYPVEDGETGTSDLVTTVSVKTTDLPEITDATVVVARGVNYRVWDKRPDGENFTALILERRS